MPASRRRRIVRWTAIAVVAPVLLLASYVSAWLALPRAAHDGLISWSSYRQVEPWVEPVNTYAKSDNPGAATLFNWWWRINGFMGRNGRMESE